MIDQGLAWLGEAFSNAQRALFEPLAPLLFEWGWGHMLEDAYAACGWFMMGLLQVTLMLLVITPLQRWRPLEPLADRGAVRGDVIYTLVHRLGLFRLGLFFALDPVFLHLFGALRAQGLPTWHLDQIWPGVTDQALVSFLIYLVAFDFLAYWIHRAQHRSRRWWALHALHHSQRQMTLWSDNRNHVVDDIAVDCLLVLAAQLIGVGPQQFMILIAITQLSESLQHANMRLSAGPLVSRLWVTPRFHRAHHSIESGEHNYGVLLPWWDMLFGTARFDLGLGPTGVMDQITRGRDYGHGLWAQQRLGLLRLIGKG
jgi:sterol desaturase/sphingolipid hydroxylase (fatty acid hydroxylase superfamily)